MILNYTDVKFYYINLDHRNDRKKHIENLLDRNNITNYSREPAIVLTKDSLLNGEYNWLYKKSVEWMKNYLNENDSIKQKKAIAHYGVYLSHYNIIKNNKNNDPIVILEDDVQFTKSALKRFFDLYNKQLYNRNVDLVRPCKNVFKNKSLFNESLDFNLTYANFKCPFRCSKYANDKFHHLYLGTHFCLYLNSRKFFDYMNSDKVYAIDSVVSTNQCKSYLLDVNITQNREKFLSDISDNSH